MIKYKIITSPLPSLWTRRTKPCPLSCCPSGNFWLRQEPKEGQCPVSVCASVRVSMTLFKRTLKMSSRELKQAGKQACKQALERQSVGAMPWRGLFFEDVPYAGCHSVQNCWHKKIWQNNQHWRPASSSRVRIDWDLWDYCEYGTVTNPAMTDMWVTIPAISILIITILAHDRTTAGLNHELFGCEDAAQQVLMYVCLCVCPSVCVCVVNLKIYLPTSFYNI